MSGAQTSKTRYSRTSNIVIMPKGLDADCPRCGTKWPYDRKNKQFFMGECPAKCGYVGGPLTTPKFGSRLRLLDPNSMRWAIRHIYVIMAVAGLALIVSGYLARPYLEARDREIFESLSPEDPDWLYYRDIGDSLMFFAYSLYVGGALGILSPVVAVLYFLMSRGVTLRLKRSNA